VTQVPFVIGRTEGALIIPNPNISRRHAQIDFDAGLQAYVITDLKSSNGTILNNQRLAPDQPVLLSNGSIIGLGLNVIIRFNLH
jgi:pSer/pThr/pTyr-binding forkhead associated (FHA) protein